MTAQEVILVKRSWKIFSAVDPSIIGDVFYSRLFMLSPALKNMFRSSMYAQYVKLVDMLNLIVARLDRIEELKYDIEQLAMRHVSYGVKTSHYQLVGDSLLWTLEKGLGNDWNEAVAHAWKHCYTELSDVMIKATEEHAASFI